MSGNKVTVERVVHARGDGAAIFTALDVDGRRVRVLASAKALPHLPGKGDVLDIAGASMVHPRYGVQLIATRCVPVIPRGRLIIRYLSDSPAYEGLGPVKAERLWSHFGEQLLDVLNAGDEDRLSEVIGVSLASIVCDVWKTNIVTSKLINRLDELGFEMRIAGRLIRVWGDQAELMLNRNPYHMLAFASWRVTDAAATRLGIERDDERRLVGAVEAVLYERLMQAHTIISDASLRGLLRGRLDVTQIGRAISLADEAGALAGGPLEGWQAIGAAALERRIEAYVRGTLTAVQSELFTPKSSDMAWVDTQIADAETALGFTLTSEQRDAVRMATTHPVSLLLGGAGVGKTVVLGVVCRVAEAMNLGVIQVALAGRAAKRMADATGRPAMTIAKLLTVLKSGTLELTASTLLIVDEASMLDLPTTYRLLHFLPAGVRVLLVGDPAQLPPIGFGLVFHRMAQVASIPKTLLTQVHRQARETGIPVIAGAIRAHQIPELGSTLERGMGVAFVPCAAVDAVDVLTRLSDVWRGDDMRIICGTKSGPAGTDAINEALHRRNPNATEGDEFALGDPVMHLTNDYDRGLMNGSLGSVVQLSDESLTIDFDGTVHTFLTGEIPERLVLSYAITCHKAQGSQFDRVAVVVMPSRILDHALLYTAVTRAVKQVVLIGDRHAFDAAVAAPPHAHRREVSFFADAIA